VTADSAPTDAVRLDAARPMSIEEDGETWTVSEEGGGRSGTGSDIGASLMLLRFSPGSGDRPPREVLVAAHSLEELGDDGLRDVFQRAKPHHPPPQKPVTPEPVTDDATVSE
jgi:hypothetical protein